MGVQVGCNLALEETETSSVFPLRTVAHSAYWFPCGTHGWGVGCRVVNGRALTIGFNSGGGVTYA